ncbi:MAG: acyl-CoA thioesterase [Clostridiaceae bacterium]|nr:acyl-CoA thioesterase [Clostridiaceae bacterium]
MKPYIHKVQYYETDKMQFTHHSNYIRFMEEARIDLMEQLGWGYDKMEQEHIISPVIDISCHYKKSTSYPDVIKIIVTVEKLSSVKLILAYQMYVEDELVCESASTHCFLNETGKPINLKRQYPDFYSALENICH